MSETLNQVRRRPDRPPKIRSDVDFKDRTVDERLHFYVKGGLWRQVAKELENGANPNAIDDEGMTALHYAAALGSRSCLRLLVKSDRCDYTIRDKKGRYPAMLAMKFARDYAVARLLTTKRVQQEARESVE